jgi:hypothetical protein
MICYRSNRKLTQEPREIKRVHTKTAAQMFLQHYSHSPGSANNPNAYQLMNRKQNAIYPKYGMLFAIKEWLTDNVYIMDNL